MSIGVENGAIMVQAAQVLRSDTDVCCCEGGGAPTQCSDLDINCGSCLDLVVSYEQLNAGTNLPPAVFLPPDGAILVTCDQGFTPPRWRGCLIDGEHITRSAEIYCCEVPPDELYWCVRVTWYGHFESCEGVPIWAYVVARGPQITDATACATPGPYDDILQEQWLVGFGGFFTWEGPVGFAVTV